MNGGNISDGQNGDSGNVIELQGRKKTAPPEVNNPRPPVRPVEQQLATLKERYNRDRDRWVEQMNSLTDKIKHVRDTAERGLESLRMVAKKKQEELEVYEVKFAKYLEKNDAQEDEIDALKKRIEELESQ